MSVQPAAHARLLMLTLILLSVVVGCDGGITGKPAAPLSVSWRRSALDSAGLVLQVSNTSGHSLSCRLVAQNKTLNQATAYTFDLGPWKSTEIGILEAGWTFKSGEGVWIEVEGFATKSFSVP